MKKVFWSPIAFIVIVAIVFGLYQSWRMAFTDRSLLSDLPCAAPCWQGITPGRTTDKEALSILNNSKYVNQKSVTVHGTSEVGGCVWDWRVPYKWIQPSISWQEGIVEEITMGLTFDVTVKDAIDKFGLPDAVMVVPSGTPERWYWIVILYYWEKGLEFRAYTKVYSDSFVPSTEVGTITYFAPTTMETRIVNEYQDLSESATDKLHPWKGYGHLQTLYP